MREVADAERIRRLMRALGAEAEREGRVYFTGGATAVLLGWRRSTIDVDLRFEPEIDSLLRALPRLKEELRINIELASPVDFIPVPSGWEERSPFIGTEGRLSFFHFDLYAQALAKLERSHVQDLEDVQAMIRMGFVERSRAVAYFEQVEQGLYRYPAIDPKAFRRVVEEVFGSSQR